MNDRTDIDEEGFSELRSFVSGSLKAVMGGISDVQSEARMDSPFGSGVHAYNAPQEVSFDIAVTAERASSKKGGFSLKVMSVGAEANADGNKTDSTATRIKFTVRTEFKRNDSGKPIEMPSRGVV